MTEIAAADARTIADEVRAGRLRATDVLEECLRRIERLNPALNALVHVDASRACDVAASVDAAVAAGRDPGPLAGVPLGIKELEPVEGWPWPRGSTAFRDAVATTTTTMSSRLLAAGAVPVGLTASPELGLLFFTNSVLHGATRNPWNTERTPGGSSGGSAAALAAGLVHLATGGDMGGSIRLPAGWCGVVGVKGTYGRIPRGPAYLGGAHLVHYGPLARSVGDAARFLDCAVGPDERDAFSLPAPAVPFEQAIGAIDLAGVRVAVVDETSMSPCDPDVAAAVREAAADLVAGAGLVEVRVEPLEFPSIDDVGGALLFVDLDPEVIAVLPEVMANLAATEGAAPLLEMAFDPSGLDLGGITRAFQLRHSINMRLASLFEDVDLLVLPTAPVPAFGATGPVPTVVAGREVGPVAGPAFTSPFNVSGHPAVSVPAGLVDGVPVGMQIVARRHDDALALAAAAAVERLRPWPKLAPVGRDRPSGGVDTAGA